ncbi:hypothetical protein [Fibrobacter intestinalis]|uniref:hypothetical protein n=1 Tax=Fibrobacter TaxID=832 RepID=UPI0013043ED9|nr:MULTISPECIES: hypothetical protein [Fibrobacter]
MECRNWREMLLHISRLQDGRETVLTAGWPSFLARLDLKRLEAASPVFDGWF